MAARAREVARAQRVLVSERPLRPARLLARLADTRRILRDAHVQLLAAASAGLDSGPAAEWLLDNYHIVQEQLQEVRASLPSRYYRELPELAAGAMTGYPRVYEIAIALISHSEARIDLANVDLFVESFQSVVPLTIGELWAMPAMLRLGLIESVRRLTLRTIERLNQRARAETWAARIAEASARDGTTLRSTMREFADTEPTLGPHFVSRLLQLLRQADGASPPLRWLEHWMRERGLSPENSVAEATQRLALTQIMMANSITSLRSIGRRDWRAFVEHQSAMDAVLGQDPAESYRRMTFATRDQYRHVVERIAKGTNHRETSVAQWAIDLARRHAALHAALHDGSSDRVREAPVEPTTDSRRSHVGFYLVDAGLSLLERTAGYRPTIRERVERWIRTHSNMVLVGGVATCTVLASGAVLLLAESLPRSQWWLIGLMTFLPALDIAVNAFNLIVTAMLPPRPLPRLDFAEHGIPPAARTAVVVPTLFGSVDDVREALEHLETQFLANREAHLHFAILSDFVDAATETRDDDTAIIEAAIAGIDALNERHEDLGVRPFSLWHRPRRWNAMQGVWMGWERKRGKLAEFNRLLRTDASDTRAAAFDTVVGDRTQLLNVQYVITLDADTVLPPGAAASLVGAMAHPLNRAVFDVAQQRMLRGYGILQPQVGVSLPSAHHSTFAAIASGHPGVDPYTVAASDVYQDLFGEGSFTGKGIYDVDAFQAATHGRFPENVLLSHDLLEGNYARAGLATDVIVYDDYPTSYAGYTRRKHRWIRGDWQLLPWLHRRVPGPDGLERNRLSLVSRWKILDNLRRSTTEIAQMLLLLAGWTLLPGSPVRWSLLVLGAVVAPWVIALLRAMLQPPFDKSWRAYYGAVMRDAIVSAQQAAVALAFLPHQAVISADAIVRTLYRVCVSRRHLLDWQSASIVEVRMSAAPGSQVRQLRATVAIVLASAIGISALALTRGLPATVLVGPGVVLWTMAAWWTASPWLSRRLSRPAPASREPLSASERDTATNYAMRHWQYFAQFVTDETHWLAPDNVQTDPVFAVAMRTSPTNIGLQLLATVSAHDLGFIELRDMIERLERACTTLQQLARFRGHFYNWYDLTDLSVLGPRYVSTVDSGNLAGHLIALRQACLAFAEAEPVEAKPVEAELATRLRALADLAYGWMSEMEFGFLYDVDRKLFTIGYHPDTFTPDTSLYDLLGSEARLASYVAIAKKDVPVEHWFRLSRALNRNAGAVALISWTGSMFEYLMPALVMRSLPFTMLDRTYRGAVKRHRAYARARGVPFGISESAYNVRDHQQTYQYRAFGVPDLALKRGLGTELVIAPYAAALAGLIDPPAAIASLRHFETLGALAPFGFCDALDYTRPEKGEAFAAVHAYMAHHIGMTLVALTNMLLDDRWQDRFHSDALMRSAELLLHERVPRRLEMQPPQRAEPSVVVPSGATDDPVVREVDVQRSGAPHVAMLGAVPYAVMVNADGSGYSTFNDLAVTRWRADSAQPALGQFCYLRDVDTGRVWSAADQPVCAPADDVRAWLGADRVTLRRVDGDLETRTTITVVPADGAEVRCVTLTNTGTRVREIELTSYGEIVLGSADADQSHPAFANLFVETEWHAWCNAVTATRRARTPNETPLWCVHVVDSGLDRVGPVSCETDRARFIGRGRSVRHPAALDRVGPLSGTTGAVLDPVFALRTRVHVRPGQSVSVTFTTLVATSRADAFALADRYHDSHAAQRALDFTWSATHIELRELGISPSSAAAFQELAAQLLYRGTSLAPPADERQRNRNAQPTLWALGISGDRPIVLATIESLDGLATLRELCVAHRYWRRRGLAVDLIIVNGQPHDYLQALRDGINDVLVAANDATHLEKPGGVFVRRRDAFSAEQYLMCSATARVRIPCDGRSLERLLSAAEARAADARALDVASASAVERMSAAANRLPTPMNVAALEAPPERVSALASLVSVLRPIVAPLLPLLPLGPRPAPPPVASTPQADQSYPNGVGALDIDHAYQMRISSTIVPPAPWANIIANERGGCVVSESGAGCTWAENAHFFRLTPWHNDPVGDPISDVLYLRDLDSDLRWAATPAPMWTATPYDVRHAPGESTFASVHDDVATQLSIRVPTDAAAKLSVLRVQNRSTRRRRIAITAFVEWTLGAQRAQSQHSVRTRFVADSHVLLAENTFDPSFNGWTAYLAASEPITSFTADRAAFIGARGTVANPEALRADALNANAGLGLDPCGAIQMMLTLAPGESREIAVLLGAAATEGEALRDVRRFRADTAARVAGAAAVAAWRTRLSVITVSTPSPEMDALLNTWALYQTLGCRLWARTGVYQSSGAYGFRDQLQDVMALLYAEPGLARAHIVRAAARQFVEGDVQHWWHAHSGRGVRTRFSDDLAWLPFVVERYTTVTGDIAVLDELVPFLKMRALEPHEHELYDLPTVTDDRASVYEHCRRALTRACTTGAHGLPLIGTGDWNDGMSRVGAEGRGESVWLAWFLVATLRAFAPLAEARGDVATASSLRAQADAYAAAVEGHGWDGAWYRRAFFDDGTPMGSAQSNECRIDSIAQSWSVLSGAASADRQAMAMAALNTQLVRERERIVLLLTPPFDHGESSHDPGYISGYVPGVRENGAQYTHAALWAVQATAVQGDGDRAFTLWQMLNPFTHTVTADDVARYKTEPYAIAADVYTAPGHVGRGGWTWYTGSASWMYRVGLEQLLGFTKVGNTLRFAPNVPTAWPSFTVHYQFGASRYEITVVEPSRIRAHGAVVTIDGVVATGAVIPLLDDNGLHTVRVQAIGSLTVA